MVENFTPVDENAYKSDLNEGITIVDKQFEEKIKLSVQSLAKEPSQKTIDNILQYSKSYNK
ncbi:hypothetical protein [Sphingobacterium rhinopitheci]|uniref:hypothetical protein n=1 Tax=Sphingobacterium rhinopitheci TaxID=2781960 RepID=UPI001F51E2F6|nr:hypothetical protein [Sphingobacterium rhinopitheci]MCI0920007.1 hypothetical protein [Sphingobacterium rhinopitheci]